MQKLRWSVGPSPPRTARSGRQPTLCLMVQPSTDSSSGGLPGANRRCLSIKLHQSQLAPPSESTSAKNWPTSAVTENNSLTEKIKLAWPDGKSEMVAAARLEQGSTSAFRTDVLKQPGGGSALAFRTDVLKQHGGECLHTGTNPAQITADSVEL